VPRHNAPRGWKRIFKRRQDYSKGINGVRCVAGRSNAQARGWESMGFALPECIIGYFRKQRE